MLQTPASSTAKAFCSKRPPWNPAGLCLRPEGEEWRGDTPELAEAEGRALPGRVIPDKSPRLWGRAMLERIAGSSAGWPEQPAPPRRIKRLRAQAEARSRARTRQRSEPTTAATGGSWETSLLGVQPPAWLRHGHSQGPPCTGGSIPGYTWALPTAAARSQGPPARLRGCPEMHQHPPSPSAPSKLPRKLRNSLQSSDS